MLVLRLGGGQRCLGCAQAVLRGIHLGLNRNEALLILGLIGLLLLLGGLQRILRGGQLRLG